METGRVHGDRESTWAQGEYMGTVRVPWDRGSTWEQEEERYMGTDMGQGEHMGSGD